jgi:hypothetical protein
VLEEIEIGGNKLGEQALLLFSQIENIEFNEISIQTK